MKKLCWKALGIAVMVSLAGGMSYAASSANVTVKFTVTNLSISVNPSQLTVGVISAGQSSIASSSITVINDGNTNETFQLSCTTFTTPSNFQLVSAAPASATQFRVLGIFNSATQPVLGNYDTTDDVLTGTPVSASATKFSGSEQGDNVAVGQSRGLWLRIDAPTGNPASAEQTFTVTINAVAP